MGYLDLFDRTPVAALVVATSESAFESTLDILVKIASWLILPVVICLSQRLSHACLSINTFILRNCERLIISVIIYLIVSSYLDNRSNSRANTCKRSRLVTEGMYLLGPKSMLAIRSGKLMIHNN